MKKKFLALTGGILLLSGMGVVSCSSDDNKSGPDPVEEIKIPTATAFSDFRKSVLESQKQFITATIDENGMFSFTSKKGVKVEVGYLDAEGGYAQKGDEVTCTFIELYDKGTMALTNRPTMGTYPNRDEYGYFEIKKDDYGRISAEGYRGFIITGGEFYFDIKLKGQQVTNYGINMVVPAAHTGGLQDDMLLWQGNINEKDDLTFTELPLQTEMGNLWANEENNTYAVSAHGWSNLPTEIGWSNIDKYVIWEGEKTQFFVKVPTGYNYENAAIYLGVKDEKGLAHLDIYAEHPTLGMVFTEHYGWVPVGLEGYVFFISLDANTNKVVYAIKDIRVEKNKLIEFKTEDLKVGTTEEVISILNQLQ